MYFRIHNVSERSGASDRRRPRQGAVMHVMIRCKVRPDGVEAGLESFREVYEEMRSVQPKGLRYATFQLEDKVTFVSFAEMEGPEVLGPLEAFQRLRATPRE